MHTMCYNTVWSVSLAAFVITTQIRIGVADSPRFVDSIRMRQRFIAWPARHNIRMKCKANGSTPLKFQWFKDGQATIERRLQPRLKTNMWYLKLKDLVPLDSGRYTCVVSNSYGSINHTYTLKVVEKSRTRPILKCSYPQNTSVLLGENASLTCVVLLSGTLPDFRWLKWKAVPKTYPSPIDFQNGSYSLVNPTQYETVYVEGKYGVKVNIPNVTSKDLGMYTCYVSNHLGYDYRNAFLTALNKLWRGSGDTLTHATVNSEKSNQANSENLGTLPTRETKLSSSSKPRTSRSREPKIPLSVFIGVLSTWAVITAMALLWCHFYHTNIRSPNLGEGI
ncbi:fibroblast growth factor receptor-like 1 isoform X2 [Montipora foliosa]|uniref:fibroblast growth factor receptor-like 1 isoform X2 n=1 Tax=Montipora foliosa TaxID=591990 RepID=UPI0035F10BFC